MYKAKFSLRRKTTAPVTLDDKLRADNRKPVRFMLLLALAIGAGLLVGFGFSNPLLGLEAGTIGLILVLLLELRNRRTGGFLARYDRQGFVKDLRLADKTVVFDGNNIYHFGLENGVGTKALSLLVQALRGEGFRIVCFFDANIYFTLLENGAFKKGRGRFSTAILQRLFRLDDSEIYVVPSGVQADLFIVEILSLLPVSFAVTNDRFRDFEDRYDFLTRDKSWRKGVSVKGGVLQLYRHPFKPPLKMSGGTLRVTPTAPVPRSGP